ncbi:MAG: hypothetical protein ACUBOA_13235 [Candidatus Loosdrechtia sp.]|uniref:hypothetical protein n=1 Tax=Candidatus Loosdrechtia sp. TaxID=3101272 RepID=UPI003A739A61|nr:MAG: hypothetical protein QY305_03190 [Candidatus Jettenia sp. AMX2]
MIRRLHRLFKKHVCYYTDYMYGIIKIIGTGINSVGAGFKPAPTNSYCRLEKKVKHAYWITKHDNNFGVTTFEGLENE